MTQPISFKANDVSGEFSVAIKSLSVPVAAAAKATMVAAGALLKTQARAMIARAGFSTKWQNAYRVTVYPEGSKTSINAAAFGRSNIKFADIFSTGGTIHGKPYLWVPFSTTPNIDRRKTNADPKDFIKKGIKLVELNRGRHLLLGAEVMVPRSFANRRVIKVSVAELEAGVKRTRGPKRQKAPAMIRKTIPLFFAINSLTIKQRFNWDMVLNRVQAQVPALYDANIAKLASK